MARAVREGFMEAVTQSRVWAGRGPGQAEGRAFQAEGTVGAKVQNGEGLGRGAHGLRGEGDPLGGDFRGKNSKLKIRDRTFLSRFLMK